MCIITVYFVGYPEENNEFNTPVQLICERDKPAFQVCFLLQEYPNVKYFTVETVANPGYTDDIAKRWGLTKLKKEL